MGDSALSVERQVINNTCRELMRLIGASEEQIQIERKWINQPVKLVDGVV